MRVAEYAFGILHDLAGFVPQPGECHTRIHTVDLDLQYVMTICQLEMVLYANISVLRSNCLCPLNYQTHVKIGVFCQ